MLNYKSISNLQLYLVAFGSSFISTDSVRSLGYTMMAISILLSFRTLNIKMNNWDIVDSFFLLLVITSFLSSLFHGDIVAPLYVLLLALSWFSIRITVFQGKVNLKQIYRAFFLSSFLLICLSIILVPPSLTRYEGIFYNPNSMGNLASLLLIMNYATNPEIRLGLTFRLMSRVILLFVILVSSSRLSLFGLLGIIPVVFFVGTYRGIIKFFINSFAVKFLGFIIIMFSAVIVLRPIYKQSIAEKVRLKSDDFSNGRLETWANIVDQIPFYGNGRDYTEGINMHAAKSAHNTFIGLFAQNGVIPAIIYVIIWLIFLRKALKMTRRKQNRYSLFLLSVVLTFIVFSTSESMNTKPHMFVAFWAMSSIINQINFKTNEANSLQS